MKTAMLTMLLAMVAGTLQAEVTWKWDDSNRPAGNGADRTDKKRDLSDTDDHTAKPRRKYLLR